MGNAARAPISPTLLKEYSWVHLTTGDPNFQLQLPALPANLDYESRPIRPRRFISDGRLLQLRQLLQVSEILFANVAEAEKAAALLGVPRPGL